MSDVAGPVIIAGFLVVFVAVGALFLLVAARILGKVGKHGGVAGALYDGRVGRVYGTMVAAPRGLARVTLKVVGVERARPEVGIEVHVNARIGYSMRAVRLAPDEAIRIADALESVARR